MIYILSGNDLKNKSLFLRKIDKKNESIFISSEDFSRSIFTQYALSVDLFGGYPIIVAEDVVKNAKIDFRDEDLSLMSASQTIFIFLEEKLLAADSKRYSKYSKIEDFTIKEIKKIPKINTFSIADAFAKRDKINTWILYREAVSSGIAPEEISGIIFWKIKAMLLSGSKVFNNSELKSISSDLVSVYHKAHRGEIDFVIGLEQFILKSLSK